MSKAPFCVAALTILSAYTSQATTVMEVTNQELTQQAETIVIGRCVGLRSAWEGRALVTVATIAVTETLKGSPGETLAVALPGGIDVNRKVPIAMTYPGAPTMQPGEDVFLFLARDPQVSSGDTVIGFSQGKFSIVTDPQQRKFISRDLTKVTLASGPGLARGTRVLVPLDEFKAEIRKNLGGAQ